MFLKSSDAQNSAPQKKVWYRSKIVFVAFVTVFALLAALMYVGITSLIQEPLVNNLVCFTCRPSTGNQTFAVMVEVNVTDGMDQDEAIKVANKVFGKGFELDPNYDLRSVSIERMSDEHGIWLVDFYVVYTTTQQTSGGGRREHAWEGRTLHGYFKVVINPFDQTAVYSN